MLSVCVKMSMKSNTKAVTHSCHGHFPTVTIYFTLIVKLAMFAYENHTRIRSLNQPVVAVLSNEGTVSCSRKQRELLLGL